MTDEAKYPSLLAERFQIRLPDGLRDRVKAYAERNDRSMNTEIIRVLEAAFPPEGAATPAVDGFELRDWFAGQALNGIVAGYWGNPEMSGLGPREFAEDAYAVADAMMRAREGGA
ncbi:Arc family DNA-binding protein [Acuticoccus sediminis]|uniref:Arc family DNA-binding protein n=1 Tax=Acuticoccus sediminis TaxID=2184697 RepID=UPI001CFF22AF|nr:Arc family DNA-binding protein [Acuticoccus sediminis]